MLREERGITILDKYSAHVEKVFLYLYVYTYVHVHIGALSTFTGLQEGKPKEVCVPTDCIEAESPANKYNLTVQAPTQLHKAIWET